MDAPVCKGVLQGGGKLLSEGAICPLEVVVADNPPHKHGLLPDFPGLQKFDCYEIKMVSFNHCAAKKKKRTVLTKSCTTTAAIA